MLNLGAGDTIKQSHKVYQFLLEKNRGLRVLLNEQSKLEQLRRPQS